MLGIAERSDRHRAGSAVQRGARVIAQRRAPKDAAVAGADDEQIRTQALGLLMKAATRARRDEADELRLYTGRAALLLEQLAGVAPLLCSLATMHVGERQLSIGICQTRGQRDGIAAVGPAVDSHEHVLEHHDPSLDRWGAGSSLGGTTSTEHGALCTTRRLTLPKARTPPTVGCR